MSTTEPGAAPESPGDAFARLPRGTQIGRMRGLAEAALAAYDVPAVRLTLIAHLWNTTFRVDTSGARYMLRIHRSGTPTPATVASEVAWLAALRRDTPLEVPDPVPTRDGAALTLANAPGVPRPHLCVLFRWLPGRRLERGLTPGHLERVGTLMAHLQNHSAGWTRPPGFVRGRVDWPAEAARGLPDPFTHEIVEHIGSLVACSLSPGEAQVVTAALARVRAAEEALGQGADAFGLIHADLHYRNLLFGRNVVRAIDFDDCGFGPRLFDPAVMLSELLDWPEYPALRAALLAGYRRVRPLPAAQEALLDTFIALRRMQDVLWMFETPRHPALAGDRAARARQSLACLPQLLHL